tara:strand:+ start:2446 stop:2859 length:414 start_codon:yes stop_codon:yes gene_type:complete
MLDVYKIDAHRDDVEDLPVQFMEALLAAMHDKSYGNDECATFGMIHPDHDKMYHLIIDSKDNQERVDAGFPRFYFNVVTLLDDTYTAGEYSYLSNTNLDEVDCIIGTDSLEELSEKMSEIFPVFKAFMEHGHSLAHK